MSRGKGRAKFFWHLLLVWGDDEILLSVNGSFSEHFKMKDLGFAKYLLGVEIRRRSGEVISLCKKNMHKRW